MRALTGVWVAGLIAVSLQPWRPAANQALFQFHRPFHLVAFAVTALVLWRFLAAAEWTLLPRMPAVGAWMDAILATILLGGAIELLQHLIYHNRMEWWDVRDDALAAMAAILLSRAVGAAVAVRP